MKGTCERLQRQQSTQYLTTQKVRLFSYKGARFELASSLSNVPRSPWLLPVIQFASSAVCRLFKSWRFFHFDDVDAVSIQTMQLKLSDIWCFSFLSIKTYSDVNLLFDLIWHLLLVSFYLTSTLLDSTTRPTYLSPLALSESNIFWQHLPTLQQAKIFKDNFSFPVILFLKTKAVFFLLTKTHLAEIYFSFPALYFFFLGCVWIF